MRNLPAAVTLASLLAAHASAGTEPGRSQDLGSLEIGVRSEDGDPCRECTVWVESLSGELELFLAETDAGGSVRLPSVPAGAYRVHVVEVGEHLVDDLRFVEVGAGSRATLSFRRGVPDVRVAGELHGKARGGQAVTAYAIGAEWSTSTVADDRGRFALALPGETLYGVRVGEEAPTDFYRRAASDSKWDLDSGTSVVSGELRAKHGTPHLGAWKGLPVAGEVVRLRGPSGRRDVQVERRAYTDANGAFDFGAVPAGDYRILAGGPFAKQDASGLTLVPVRVVADVDQRVDVLVAEPGATLSGELRFADGAASSPPDGVGIYVGLREDREGEIVWEFVDRSSAGAFSIERLPLGRAWIVCSSDDSISERVLEVDVLPLVNRALDVALVRCRPLDLVVHEGGRPVPFRVPWMDRGGTPVPLEPATQDPRWTQNLPFPADAETVTVSIETSRGREIVVLSRPEEGVEVLVHSLD